MAAINSMAKSLNYAITKYLLISNQSFGGETPRLELFKNLEIERNMCHKLTIPG